MVNKPAPVPLAAPVPSAAPAAWAERQRHMEAIARTAAKLAAQGSLTTILDALAAEVRQAGALAGVQILALNSAGTGLQIMGSAGFRHWPDFFDRLMECRQRGAALRMLDALAAREPVVVTDRWSVIRHDPAWAPLRAYLGELAWESFASIPMLIRGQAVGVLNVFFAPGQEISAVALEFGVAMADQAAIAIDYAALVQRSLDSARREERQRLARDLHDSIVQQVFSISMQAKSIQVLAERGGPVPAAATERTAAEIGVLAQAVLADLRAMVNELRPPSAEFGGLEEAIRALAESSANRAGLRFSLAVRGPLDQIGPEMADDVYRIIAEALHNVVKHASASTVAIRLSARDGRLRASVGDDGRGIGTAPDPAGSRGDRGGQDAGYGLHTMRERARRWGGKVTVGPGRRSGTVVRLVLPLAAGIPVTGVPVPGVPVPGVPGTAS